MASVGDLIQAKALWNGDRFSLESGAAVYVIKTYKDGHSHVTTTRAERRLATKTSGFLGMGKRWMEWDELSTPIEAQNVDQQVVKAGA